MDYDFTGMLECISEIDYAYNKDYYSPKHDCADMNKALRTLRSELNKFFSDKTCTTVIFTNNTDNKFFGIVVKPTNWDIGTLLDDNIDGLSFKK